jgi:mRNA interferase RelE/StbE
VAYSVQIPVRVQKALARIHPTDQARIVSALDALALNPRPPGAQPIKTEPGRLRVRAGDYRIVYEVDDAANQVRVVRIEHRSEVYR